MMTDPIIKTIEVPCGANQAFKIFTERMISWWPLAAHSASAADGKPAQSVNLEPRVGGDLYEIKHDGTRDHWGEVLEFVSGQKLATTWHPGSNKNAPTRLDVIFEEVSPNATRVTLTHSGWEAWADSADQMRGNYNGGWDTVFGTCFANACA